MMKVAGGRPVCRWINSLLDCADKWASQLGVTVAIGVLLDAFIVRSLLVPALALDIGPKIWWPSALAHETKGTDSDEDSDASVTQPV